jgi:hypothetical protein
MVDTRLSARRASRYHSLNDAEPSVIPNHLKETPMDLSPVLAYISNYWPKLIRENKRQEGTRIGLPRPYVVPSDGAMFQEMY